MSETRPSSKCGGCYRSFTGWWCDNCDQWPCICVVAADDEQEETDER